MKDTINISEISAEMLVNYLHPELVNRWTVQNEGTFYRNYNRDVLDWNADTAEIQLSRDSFIQLLPQGLLFRTEEMTGKDHKVDTEKLKSRKRLLLDMFQPLDTFAFRNRLRLEREVSSLLETKLTHILSRYFGIDLSKEENPYIHEVAVLLPFVSHLRGDLNFVRELLAAILHCPVQLTIGRYGQTDNTRSWIPCIRYELIMPDLSTEEYNRLMDDIRPLNAFISEWFMPMEAICVLLPKWKDADLSATPVLDYNTRLQ